MAYLLRFPLQWKTSSSRHRELFSRLRSFWFSMIQLKERDTKWADDFQAMSPISTTISSFHGRWGFLTIQRGTSWISIGAGWQSSSNVLCLTVDHPVEKLTFLLALTLLLLLLIVNNPPAVVVPFSLYVLTLDGRSWSRSGRNTEMKMIVTVYSLQTSYCAHWFMITDTKSMRSNSQPRQRKPDKKVYFSART